MIKTQLSSNTIPLREFKTTIATCLKNAQEYGHPLIITQHGKPAGVLLSPTEYDALLYQQQLIASIQRGLADVDAGKVYSTDEVRATLAEKRLARQNV